MISRYCSEMNSQISLALCHCAWLKCPVAISMKQSFLIQQIIEFHLIQWSNVDHFRSDQNRVSDLCGRQAWPAHRQSPHYASDAIEILQDSNSWELFNIADTADSKSGRSIAIVLIVLQVVKAAIPPGCRSVGFINDPERENPKPNS